jgi:glycosyltransferase involved in cell wall biosynthesis
MSSFVASAQTASAQSELPQAVFDRPLLSIVVPTLGRGQELVRLLESMERQTLQSFEVIIVDQNSDDRVDLALAPRSWTFPLTHIRTPGQRGASRARNIGWRRSHGRYVVFADDDCWYPPKLLETVDGVFGRTHADTLGGRAVNEHGRSINGRYEGATQPIDRGNVWTTSIEWMLFFRREVLDALDGFDESIGVGASTPWQAAEGQDIVLRALDAGFKCVFDPALYGHHLELDIFNPDDAMQRKARAYGRGMGFVLRRHGYGPLSLATWIGRPSIGMLVLALRGQVGRARYYFNVARGRLEGWLQSA